MSVETEKRLRAGVEKLSLSLPEGAIEKLQSYLDLLVKWNGAYNLTAIRDPGQMVVRHLLDSLSIVPNIQGASLIDVGTGAGLPGLVLAIALPELNVTLLDSNGKKVRFLRQVIADLKINNASAVHARVEEFDHQFDLVSSRAFATLADMVNGSQQLLAENGEFLAMKGVSPTEESAALPEGFSIKDVVPLTVPFLDEERHLVRIVRN